MYKVYIVDDAVLVRKELVLTTPWPDLGCVVVGQAEDGVTALLEIPKLKPDIIITDIKMASMSGLELIQNLKGQGIEAEFIVISGYSEFEYAFQAIKLEVRNYILKPISDQELIETIQKAIKRIETGKKAGKKREGQETEALSPYESFIDAFNDNNLNTHLRSALSYIKGHYGEEITLKDVAAALSISESYLGKLFKTEINTTFVEYVTRVRIREALELLRHKNMPIYEITERVGYKDYRYFSNVFKKMVGVSPKEYQKKT